jgi:glycosyltransferase involved in cell wall biosynthesis
VSDPRVTHVITGLERGGAETLLLRVLEQIEDVERTHSVISLTGKGALGPRIERLGVPIEALEMAPLPRPRDLKRLVAALRRSEPDLVQTWMLHSNVLGGAVARAALRGVPVAWGVHVSSVQSRTLGARAAAVQRLEGLFSWVVPTRIVACSHSSAEVMAGLRDRHKRIVEISNGFELPPAAEGGRSEAVRAELGFPPDAEVVGHVARFHPVKDHATLLRALAIVHERRPRARFVLCGTGVSPDNAELRDLAEPLGDSVAMLGERDDVPRLLRAFDVLVSSSAGEALPLAIGEAMASEVPVVATRCGDSEELVGDAGVLVPIRDPAALAEGLIGMLELPRAELERLGALARARIASDYSLEEMMRRYRALWGDLAAQSA